MAFSSPQMGDAALYAAVVDLQSYGCVALEYRTAKASLHRKGSAHAMTGFFGYRCAADMNHDGAGDIAEQAFFKTVGRQIAREKGLSITAGIDGYVAGHSPGDGMHMHIDRLEWSNLGHGVFRTPWLGQCADPWAIRAFQKQQRLVADAIRGPLTTKALQRAVGATPDSRWGPLTTQAVQRKVGATPDKVLGPDTYRRLTAWIEGGCK